MHQKINNLVQQWEIAQLSPQREKKAIKKGGERKEGGVFTHPKMRNDKEGEERRGSPSEKWATSQKKMGRESQEGGKQEKGDGRYASINRVTSEKGRGWGGRAMGVTHSKSA